MVHLEVEEATLSEPKGTIIIRGEHAKGGKQRHVPGEARKRREAYLESHPAGDGPPFLGQRGPLGEDPIARVVKKYAAWAQVDGVTPQVLRDTFSCAYLDKTLNDLVGLADILGYDRLATIQIHTQKPLRALQDEMERVKFF